jgi:hypothetical protein
MNLEYKYGYFTVVCIDYCDNVTIDKEYKVGNYDIIEQGSPSEVYIITNDLGYTDCISSVVFKILNKQEIRDRKLRDILD